MKRYDVTVIILLFVLTFKHVSMAALFLASKIEEVPKRSRDVINVFHHIEQVKRGKKGDPLPIAQKVFYKKF